VGSSFHRQGAAYLKERLVIFKEERVGGQARVTIDEGMQKFKEKQNYNKCLKLSSCI